MTKWISVKDRLPEKEKHVIGYALSEYGSTWYVGMMRYNPNLIRCPFWDDSCDSHPAKVTHWMPLPESPES